MKTRTASQVKQGTHPAVTAATQTALLTRVDTEVRQNMSITDSDRKTKTFFWVFLRKL
jgi:hypothetical protein